MQLKPAAMGCDSSQQLQVFIAHLPQTCAMFMPVSHSTATPPPAKRQRLSNPACLLDLRFPCQQPTSCKLYWGSCTAQLANLRQVRLLQPKVCSSQSAFVGYRTTPLLDAKMQVESDQLAGQPPPPSTLLRNQRMAASFPALRFSQSGRLRSCTRERKVLCRSAGQACSAHEGFQGMHAAQHAGKATTTRSACLGF